MEFKAQSDLALVKATKQGDEAFAELQRRHARKTPEALRALFLPLVAKAYDIKLVEGARKAAGTLVLDNEHKAYEAAKRKLSRLCAMSTKKPEPATHSRVILPKGLKDSLVDQIIASGINKEQFNLLLASIKDSVNFE